MKASVLSNRVSALSIPGSSSRRKTVEVAKGEWLGAWGMR
jgi:hypothetical protein